MVNGIELIIVGIILLLISLASRTGNKQKRLEKLWFKRKELRDNIKNLEGDIYAIKANKDMLWGTIWFRGGKPSLEDHVKINNLESMKNKKEEQIELERLKLTQIEKELSEIQNELPKKPHSLTSIELVKVITAVTGLITAITGLILAIKP